MGICPCVREHQREKSFHAKSESEVETTPAAIDSTIRDTRRSSQPRLTLRSLERIIRLINPFTSHYEPISTLKRRGCIETFTARQARSSQLCTITQIKKNSHVCPSACKNALFERLRKLDHPHLLRTYEMCQDEEFLYVVSEACFGGDLGVHLEAVGKLSQLQAASVMQQVFSALALVHRTGAVHKHISLQTLILKHTPRENKLDVRVSDLHCTELAVDYSDEDELLFAPPERHSGEYLDTSDIWSCGVLLYILLSGFAPFDSCSKGKTLFKGVSFPPAQWQGVSPDATKLIVAMLKPHPKERPSALQCLGHPWVEQFAENTARINRSLTSALLHYRPSREEAPLRDAVMRFMATRVACCSDMSCLAESFRAVDTNNDGMLSREEIVHCVKAAFNNSDPQSEAEKILMHIDVNFNGLIEYSEFLCAALQEKELLRQEALRDAFRVLDRDGNGKISIEELKFFFRIDDAPGSVEQWKALIQDIDTSGDGAIDFPEFEAMMTRVLVKKKRKVSD